MQMNITVRSPKKKYSFLFKVYISKFLESRRLEESFYKDNWPNIIPQGIHYEIQVMSEELIHHKLYRAETLKNPPLHIHPSKNHSGEHYICWTGQVKTQDEVLQLVKFWSIGTVYSMENERDFGHIFTEQNFSPDPSNEEFVTFLEEKHSIKTESYMFLGLMSF